MISDKELRLQKFDFGTDCANRTRYYETCNQQRYGTLRPPEYNLANIKVPVFMLQGEGRQARAAGSQGLAKLAKLCHWSALVGNLQTVLPCCVLAHRSSCGSSLY